MASAATKTKERSLLVFMDGIEPGADGPHGLLWEDPLERGHIHAPIPGGAVADALHEDLVAFLACGQITEVRGDAAGDGVDAVAARAVLSEGRVAGFASVTPRETPATGNSCAATGGVRLTGIETCP